MSKVDYVLPCDDCKGVRKVKWPSTLCNCGSGEGCGLHDEAAISLWGKKCEKCNGTRNVKARTARQHSRQSMPRRIAWSTKSASNGHIYQWSRWHLTHTLEKTLCGKTMPFAKWITPQPGYAKGDYRIKGGECQECNRVRRKGEMP